MSNHNVQADNYDRGIVPAETAARKEREGADFKKLPEPDQNDGIDTTGGYSMDGEGLINNYAVEPEMYYETPGDAKEQEEIAAAERAQQLREINQTDETGKLTTEGDKRGKGTGLI